LPSAPASDHQLNLEFSIPLKDNTSRQTNEWKNGYTSINALSGSMAILDTKAEVLASQSDVSFWFAQQTLFDQFRGCKACRWKPSTDCPTGKSVVVANSCPAPFAKIFRFPLWPNHLYIPRRPTPLEGRIAIVTDAGRDAVDAAASGDARGWQGGSIRPVS
jgi:hypothetical protein